LDAYSRELGAVNPFPLNICESHGTQQFLSYGILRWSNASDISESRTTRMIPGKSTDNENCGVPDFNDAQHSMAIKIAFSEERYDSFYGAQQNLGPLLQLMDSDQYEGKDFGARLHCRHRWDRLRP
jgi:hypothetical protein